ncbi:MAG TPA: hypothetical protein VGC37_18875 [Friedmanniella sp.]
MRPIATRNTTEENTMTTRPASVRDVHPAAWLDREAAEWADTARDALAPLLAADDGWAWACITDPDPDLDLVSEPGTAPAELLAHACEVLQARYGDRHRADVDPQRLADDLRELVDRAADDAWWTAFYAVSGDRDENAEATR